MNDLIVKYNGALVTTQNKISKLTNNNEISIQKLIRTYKADLEEFGILEFENQLIINSKNVKNYKKIYYLNEQQATLLLTYMKNSESVRNAKKVL
ncbi:Rha family transcriptional regulator, partial [Campylobacter jejuni]